VKGALLAVREVTLEGVGALGLEEGAKLLLDPGVLEKFGV
jgi:hypothetical protein